jgi:hypothetical protein
VRLKTNKQTEMPSSNILHNEQLIKTIDGEEIYVDPQLLFQRLLTAANGEV